MIQSQPWQTVLETLSQKNPSQRSTGRVAKGLDLISNPITQKKKKKKKKKSNLALSPGSQIIFDIFILISLITNYFFVNQK
jgi:hypothetical protein